MNKFTKTRRHIFDTEEGDSSVTEIRLDADDSREFGDSRDSQDIEIEAADVTISAIGAPTTVAGDDLQIGAEFERIGDVPVEDMTVEFIVGNETIETDDLNVDPGDTQEGEVTYKTSSSDVPELDVSVVIPEINESADTQATIISQADHEENMNVKIDSEDGVEIGNFSEELEVTGEFEYNGDETTLSDFLNGETDR
ncbi:hypothetical protein [Halostagnicola sp. A56]|uniref:hypothetical protein n=1 Tax=Halostagnicola sp. A56 TaxID=1495067 RepID=UPI0012E2573E|nr:hypothetical protein [Halostagnicola sp. A56]